MRAQRLINNMEAVLCQEGWTDELTAALHNVHLYPFKQLHSH